MTGAFGNAVPEWVRNVACITAWPAHEYAWGDHLATAQREFVGFCDALLSHDRSEPIELLVADESAERDARAALGGHGARVRYHRMRYGDVWLRDTSPIFVRRAPAAPSSDAPSSDVNAQPGSRAAVRFRFNGWGGKYEYAGDEDLAERLARLRKAPCESYEVTLEGGAIELDGEGTCLTTRSCLLNANRRENEESVESQQERVELAMRRAFSVERVLWLGDGLVGDHTDGHIDNIARYVGVGRVVHMRPSGEADPNRQGLLRIEEELRAMRDAKGRALTLHALPSPGAVRGADGGVMAASYCNFYIGNAVVVMPAFGTEYDEPARRALEAIFPRHRVLASPAKSFLEGGGTFHCMTRQEPAFD